MSKAEGDLMAQAETDVPVAQSAAPSKRVYKYLLALSGRPQVVEMPYGAKIVHVHEQVIGGDPCPVLWAEVNTTAPPTKRTFHVLATGFDQVPIGAQHVGTIHIDWTVWHVYEGRAGKGGS